VQLGLTHQRGANGVDSHPWGWGVAAQTTFAQPAYDYMREYTDWVGTD
jgi:hypothetical protein